jgi:lipoyl(octanoyl) transferase
VTVRSRDGRDAPGAFGLPGAFPQRRRLEVHDLGTVPYGEALDAQQKLVAQRRAGEVGDTLLLLEHPHVITLGSGADAAHVLVNDTERARRGIERFDVGRGGDVTYHGPGQLVAYPILDLKPDRKDLHRYLRDLEDVLIGVVGDFGVSATRSASGTGVWTQRGKVAAIGVRVSSGWITSHGVALNVTSDLSYFETIVPCGIRDRGVTSLARELGTDPDAAVVRAAFVRNFARVFGCDLPATGATV